MRPGVDPDRNRRRFAGDLLDRVALVVLDGIFKIIALGLMIAALLYVLYVADARDHKSTRIMACTKAGNEVRQFP